MYADHSQKVFIPDEMEQSSPTGAEKTIVIFYDKNNPQKWMNMLYEGSLLHETRKLVKNLAFICIPL